VVKNYGEFIGECGDLVMVVMAEIIARVFCGPLELLCVLGTICFWCVGGKC